MLQDDVDHLPGQHTPDYRLVSNPFDPPSSVHLRQRLASFSIFNEVSDSTCSVRCWCVSTFQGQETNPLNGDVLSIERRAQVNPHRLSEHIVQIDTSLLYVSNSFEGEMRWETECLVTKKCVIVINVHPIISVRHISIYLRLSYRPVRFPRREINPGRALHRIRRWIEHAIRDTVTLI